MDARFWLAGTMRPDAGTQDKSDNIYVIYVSGRYVRDVSNDAKNGLVPRGARSKEAAVVNVLISNQSLILS